MNILAKAKGRSILTVGELRAALSEFPDSASIQVGYAAGTASGCVTAVYAYADAEFEGVEIAID